MLQQPWPRGNPALLLAQCQGAVGDAVRQIDGAIHVEMFSDKWNGLLGSPPKTHREFWDCVSELHPPPSSAGAVWEPLDAADAGSWLKVTTPVHCIAAASHTARQRNRQ